MIDISMKSYWLEFIQPLSKSDGVLAHLSLGKYKSWVTSAGIWKENYYSLCCAFIKLKKINCLKNIFSFCLVFTQFQGRTHLPKLPKYAAKEKNIKKSYSKLPLWATMQTWKTRWEFILRLLVECDYLILLFEPVKN